MIGVSRADGESREGGEEESQRGSQILCVTELRKAGKQGEDAEYRGSQDRGQMQERLGKGQSAVGLRPKLLRMVKCYKDSDEHWQGQQRNTGQRSSC